MSELLVSGLKPKRKSSNDYPTEFVKFHSKPWTLPTDKNSGNKLPLLYSTKELMEMYNSDKKPTLAEQNKSGGKCAFQAYCNLLWSISSIGKGSDFGNDKVIEVRMIAAVSEVNTAMEKNILDKMNPYLNPGDLKLKLFSCHAFRVMKQIQPGVCLYRFRVMRGNKGQLLSSDWILRQDKGYFIVYGNRYPVEKENEKDLKYASSYHFLAVNVSEKLIVDNRKNDSHLRLCAETFKERLPTVFEVLRLEKLVKGGKIWQVYF